MKNIVFIVIVFAILISPRVNAQTTDLLGKTKEVKLRKSTYTISIPRQLHVTVTNGTDFLGYSIGYKNKKLIKTLKIWIYFGYFPNNLAENSRYILTDSVDINILKQDAKFKIYKSNVNYLVEGAVFANPDGVQINGSERYLQFHFSGISENSNSLRTIIDILKSLNLTEQEILVD